MQIRMGLTRSGLSGDSSNSSSVASAHVPGHDARGAVPQTESCGVGSGRHDSPGAIVRLPTCACAFWRLSSIFVQNLNSALLANHIAVSALVFRLLVAFTLVAAGDGQRFDVIENKLDTRFNTEQAGNAPLLRQIQSGSNGARLDGPQLYQACAKCLASRLVVNSAPQAKRQTGPKLFAEARPTM
jgi:hypothetical protein